jgi:hypothetical protein
MSRAPWNFGGGPVITRLRVGLLIMSHVADSFGGLGFERIA